MRRKNPLSDNKKKKKKKKIADMHEEELREYRKMMRKGKTKAVRLICSKCGRSRLVRTNNIELYTDEVKENNVCVFCQYDRAGRKIWTARGEKIDIKEDE